MYINRLVPDVTNVITILKYRMYEIQLYLITILMKFRNVFCNTRDVFMEASYKYSDTFVSYRRHNIFQSRQASERTCAKKPEVAKV